MKIRIEFTETEMKETVNAALDMCNDIDEKMELIKALDTKTVSIKNDIERFEYNKNEKFVELELDESIVIATINLSKFFFARIKDFALTAFEKVKSFVNMISDKEGETTTIIDGKNIAEEFEKAEKESESKNNSEPETKTEETTNEKENENKSE